MVNQTKEELCEKLVNELSKKLVMKMHNDVIPYISALECGISWGLKSITKKQLITMIEHVEESLGEEEEEEKEEEEEEESLGFS